MITDERGAPTHRARHPPRPSVRGACKTGRVSLFLRYSLLRLALFVAVAAVIYLVGARGWLWVLISIVVSAALSYLWLKQPRDDLAQRLAQRVEHRHEGKGLGGRIADDNAAEDAEIESTSESASSN